METICETEQPTQLSEVAEHNFQELGLEVEPPTRVIYGFTPAGGGSYMPESDTVFIGKEALDSENFYDLVVYEHENIHFEQYRRIIGETPKGFHDLVDELNNIALSTATDHFEDSKLIDALTDDQHLSFYNFKTLLGLASEHNEFLDEVKSLKDSYDQNLSQMAGVPVETVRHLQQHKIADKAEKIAKNYWKDISQSEDIQEFSPLIERHDLNLRADLLEAETQLWNIFRAGSLEDLPPEEGEFQSDLTEYLEDLEVYQDHDFYEHGENVRPATGNLLEQFRERRHTENTSDTEIVVAMINEGLENADEKLI